METVTPGLSHNGIVQMPRAFARQAEFEEAVEQTARTLGPEVVKMIPELGNDWTGDPAVFFEVVLKDGVIRRGESAKTTVQIRWKVTQAPPAKPESA